MLPESLPEVSGANVALSFQGGARGRRARVLRQGVSLSEAITGLEPDRQGCIQRPPAPPWKAELREPIRSLKLAATAA